MSTPDHLPAGRAFDVRTYALLALVMIPALIWGVWPDHDTVGALYAGIAVFAVSAVGGVGVGAFRRPRSTRGAALQAVPALVVGALVLGAYFLVFVAVAQ